MCGIFFLKKPTYGYAFRESDRAGKLDAKKAIALGASGRQLGILKNGEDVERADGFFFF